MKKDAFGMSSAEEEHCTALQSTPTVLSSPTSSLMEPAFSTLSVLILTAHCVREIDNFRRSEPWTDEYGLELLRRATVHGDQEAWTGVQQCFSGIARSWLRRHPKREVACRLESEENYVAQAFERFWQATSLTQRVEFNSLAAVLQYLRACLNGVILDTLRTYARPREVPLQEPGEPGEPHMEETTDSGEVWEILHTMLPDEREKRLAYLSFHCGLKPREIMRFCPREFRDVHEIYRLRRSIMERVQRNADQLRWRLS